MRNIIKLFIVISLAGTFYGCQKSFLEMPLSSSTIVDSVFSTAVKAQGAWTNAYNYCLSQGLHYNKDHWNAMIQENLTGGLTYGQPWTLAQPIIIAGLSPTGNSEDMDGYNSNFTYIRQAYLVKENIDKVRDMTDVDKAVVKAEMQALIAYRYEQMLIMYGGVPILSRSLVSSENLALPRSPVKAVVDSIVSWCDQAVPVLPSVWPATWTGRMTKAAALAIKAKTLLYAARPLFNSATPYLSLGENSNLICFGTYDAGRWNAAATAAEAEITEAETKGGVSIINTGNPLDDYGTATSVPSNPEILLAYKTVNTTGDGSGWNTWQMNAFYNPHYNEATANILTTSHLEDYYKQDGTNQTWPGIGAVTSFSDYTAKMNAMEARFKADFMPFQMDAWNNPGNSNWSNTSIGLGYGKGAARSVKFYYKAGSRKWFEFPIFRLASAYLSAAEAYNEMGQPGNALPKLNKIHQRAGLPAVTETDQVKLRTIIQREWAVEFFNENYRLHDMKHWKLANIGNGIIGGPIRGFAYNDNTSVKSTGNTNYNDLVMYQGFWAPKEYLNPFPQDEMNKGYLIQNPGY